MFFARLVCYDNKGMLRDEIIDFLGEDWVTLNGYIKDSLFSDIPLLQQVNEDILVHGGKMLRTIVALLVARMISGTTAPDDSIRVAAATEMLHNATLLHDDVADESPTRRGEPTLFSRIGPSGAVLVGDFWLARAMELTISYSKRDSVAKIFSKAMTNLAEGEMLQLQNASGNGTNKEDYFRIIYCKTASLFETACLSVSVSCNATPEQQEAVKEYAVSLGIAFQIKDDILDYVGDEALGKPTGIDLKEHKITLPLLCCFDDAAKEAEIRKMISDIHNHPEYCEQIRTFVLENRGVEKAGDILESYIRKSLDALDVFPDGKEKEFLTRIAKYNTIRNS